MDLSLDDLIKKNKKTKKIIPKKKPSGSAGKIVAKRPALKLETGNKQLPKSNRGQLDARSKIISKNRVKIRDAREKIAENARKSIKDARELLSTSRKAAPPNRAQKKASIPRSRPIRALNQSAAELLMDDDDFDMGDLRDLHLKPVASIKRTVRNEMFRNVAPPVTMPKMPQFAIRNSMNHGISQELPRLSPDPFDCYNVPTRRPIPVPLIRPERVERYQPGRIMSAHMDAYEPRKSILRPAPTDDHDDRFENDRYFSTSSSNDGVRSRLYNESRDRNESAGIFAKLPVRGTSPPAAQIGHRIVISNLHKTVTESDVRELFEDVGALMTAKLVRQGVAEVIYKNLGDAEEAVETYHNRQLDGQPMKCMLCRSSGNYSRL